MTDEKQKDKDGEVTVKVTKGSKTGKQEVEGTSAATDPFDVDNSNPADPNGYNDAAREHEGFIKNPVAGGAIPSADEGDIVNGVTQIDGDDLPESNVDPDGVLKGAAKPAKGTRKKSK